MTPFARPLSPFSLHAETLDALHPAQTLRLWHVFLDAADASIGTSMLDDYEDEEGGGTAAARYAQGRVWARGGASRAPPLREALARTALRLPAQLVALAARLCATVERGLGGIAAR